LKALEGSSTATRPRISADRCATPRPDGFRLTGPSRRLDPRINAFRPDIADVALAGMLFAPHYVRADQCRCTVPATMMRARPNADAPAVSQIVLGEAFALLDLAGGWAWGYSMADHYVGYVQADTLGPIANPTHRIVVPSAILFARPDIKAPRVATLPLGSQHGGVEADGFLRTDQGYIHLRHAAPLGRRDDPVAAAERMIGLPYLWGGRGGEGIDCSGLIQRALECAGIAAPRDSDQQREALGAALDDNAPLVRGDLVFFPGHVGIMVDADRLLHANAYWMGTVVEPLADVVARLAPNHAQPITARKRLTL
jgi:cell wall-associated NlpC family hydrolase